MKIHIDWFCKITVASCELQAASMFIAATAQGPLALKVSPLQLHCSLASVERLHCSTSSKIGSIVALQERSTPLQPCCTDRLHCCRAAPTDSSPAAQVDSRPATHIDSAVNQIYNAWPQIDSAAARIDSAVARIKNAAARIENAAHPDQERCRTDRERCSMHRPPCRCGRREVSTNEGAISLFA